MDSVSDDFPVLDREAILDDRILINVHTPDKCFGQPCVVHNRTDHHMRGWPLHWRDGHGIFERICPCGVGHPDPDQFSYWRQTGQEWQAVHGCCGCCGRPA